MITTSDTIAIRDGEIIRYAAPDIRVVPQFLDVSAVVSTRLEVLDGDNVIADVLISLSPAALDATVQAATHTRNFFGAAEEVAVAYLEGLAANSGATFSIV